MTRDLARAAWLAGAVALATAALALVVRVAGAADAREQLGFTFAALPQRPSQVASILANNLALLGVALGAAVVAQLWQRTGAAGLRMLALACDVIIVLACLKHVLLVGVTLGAYGRTGMAAVLSHGPLELAAYSVGLSLYVAARRERVDRHRAVCLAGIGAAGLAVAAVAEVFA